MISVDQVTMRYGDVTALNELSLQVDEGCFFGLLGPNGAGKSTAIACIAGLRTPQAGQIRLGGIDVAADRPRAQAQLGLVPQSIALFPDLSVANNLATFGGIHGLSRTKLRERIAWGLELAQLEGKRDAKVETLSGGMARRLNLACGLMHDPRVIICDEPTAGVDPQSRNHIFDMLRTLHAEGRTIVYTTHYMEEIEALCEQVAIMDRGRVIAHDSLEALLRPPSPDGEHQEHQEHQEHGQRSFQLELAQPATLERVQAALANSNLGDDHPLVGSELKLPPRSLEQLFLDLTGRSLRDESESASSTPPNSASPMGDAKHG